MRTLAAGLMVLGCIATGGLAGATSAGAATIVVTSGDDVDDGTCDGPHCSLREAILEANSTSAADDLVFARFETITPTTPLPAITAKVFITALASGRCNNDSAPLRLKGRGADFSGLVFASGSDGSRICLATVGGFRTGIELRSDGNVVKGSSIGTDVDGASADPNEDDGILVTGDGNLIGGDFTKERNVLSGNDRAGVFIAGGTGNRVVGNAIGVDRLGVLKIPNGAGVVVDEQAEDTSVGGTASGEGNVISGNDVVGVEAAAGRIVGNHIGVDSFGDFAVPNRDAGVRAVGPVQIGGPTDAERNVISGHDVDLQLDAPAIVEGNWIGPAADGRALEDPSPLTGREVGIRLRAAATGAEIRKNVVAGQEIGIESIGESNDFAVEDNLVGLTPDGTTEITTLAGVRVGRESGGAQIAGNTVLGTILGLELLGDDATVEGNTVGLDTAGAAHGELPDVDHRAIQAGVTVGEVARSTTIVDNTISGLATGVELQEGGGPTAVEDNRIGTDAAGERARPNLFGLVIGPQTQVRIAGNVLSGNEEAGVLSESRTIEAVVEDNDIGVAGDGKTALGNGTGIRLSDEKIAGSATGDGFVIRSNRIAHNTGDGVAIVDIRANTRIESNEILANGDLGIDFLDDGVSRNGQHAPDALPPFPLLTNVDAVSAGTSVQGTIDHPAGHRVRIELFASPACDDAGHGQGHTPLGTLTLIAPGSQAAFSVLVDATPGGSGVITATATDLTSNRTSELSPCALRGATPTPPVVVTPPPGGDPGGGPPPPAGTLPGAPPIGLAPVEEPPRIRCKVPKVAGLTLAKAKKRIKAAGCGVGKITRPGARRRKGSKLVVKRTSRRPGMNRNKGTKVDLTLGFARVR